MTDTQPPNHVQAERARRWRRIHRSGLDALPPDQERADPDGDGDELPPLYRHPTGPSVRHGASLTMVVLVVVTLLLIAAILVHDISN